MTPLEIAVLAALVGGVLTITAAALGARWQASGVQTEDTRQRGLDAATRERAAILSRLDSMERQIGKADARLSSIETALLYLLPAYQRIMAGRTGESHEDG